MCVCVLFIHMLSATVIFSIFSRANTILDDGAEVLRRLKKERFIHRALWKILEILYERTCCKQCCGAASYLCGSSYELKFRCGSGGSGSYPTILYPKPTFCKHTKVNLRVRATFSSDFWMILMVANMNEKSKKLLHFVTYIKFGAVGAGAESCYGSTEMMRLLAAPALQHY
jgi:hypothetical protein